jgi:hypothetical protein
VPEPSNHATRGSFLCLQRFYLICRCRWRATQRPECSRRSRTHGLGSESSRSSTVCSLRQFTEQKVSRPSTLASLLYPSGFLYRYSCLVRGRLQQKMFDLVGNSDRRDPATNTLTLFWTRDGTLRWTSSCPPLKDWRCGNSPSAVRRSDRVPVHDRPHVLPHDRVFMGSHLYLCHSIYMT